ncbi:MAG: hypothetical protein AAGG56_10235 [Pseudomonadota bacterium]
MVWKLAILGSGVALALGGCSQDGVPSHKSSAAERACYSAVANRQAFREEIMFVSTRYNSDSSDVTLEDPSGRWYCIATNDGKVVEINGPDPNSPA